MDRLKRIFCVFLALVLLLTSPGIMPVKTEANPAVAGADLLSLGLLFFTWAGVSFEQSDQAVTVVQKFLNTKVGTAMKLSALITKGVLQEGKKLLLTPDVRVAYKEALPEIHTFVPDDKDEIPVFRGESYKSVPVGVELNTSKDFFTDENAEAFYNNPSAFSPICIDDLDGCKAYLGGIPCSILGIHNNSESAMRAYRLDDKTELFPRFRVPYKFFLRNRNGALYACAPRLSYASGKYYWEETKLPFSSIVVYDAPANGSVYYGKSATVNGSSSLAALESANLDENEREYPIAPVTKVVSSGLAGATTAPGLSAEEYEKILADVLASTAVLPTTPQPTTAEPEPTTATPDEEKVHPITPDILGGMFDGLKGWLQSLLNSILEAIRAISEKIDSLWESMKAWWSQTIADMKAWWTQTIADIKTWIEVKIQSIGAWWTTFWAETKALILSISTAITEFFTVTFPAWITDVKEWALALPKTLVDAIVLALSAVFVPAAGYWDAKVAALQARFPLFNSILTTGKGFTGFFSGLGSRPPIIYIDLGSSGSWAMGGRTIFLDLTWYSQYKPTMDTVIAGFLWLLFAWRFFLRLPGLLRGEVGTIDRLNSYLSEKRDKNGG